MLIYALKRLLGTAAVLFTIVTLTFFLVRLAPGGPFDADKKIPPEIRKNIEAIYHMDEPLPMQYLRYVQDLAHGDLGPSFRYAGRSVTSIIAGALPTSMLLGAAALLYALGVGLVCGLIAAGKPGSVRDHATTVFSLIGVCLPSFVIGPLLVIVFSVKLGWLRASGLHQATDLILPAVALGTIYAAFIARLARAGLVDLMRQDFVRTARAKGLSEIKILIKHCTRGGLLPVVSFVGPAAAGLMTGSFVVESLFNIPGVGRFFVQAAVNRDYTLLMGMVLLFSVILLTMNVLVEIAYAFLDPRIKAR